MKIGLIGCGYWGKNLIRDFYSLNVLDTICDIREDILEEFKNKYPTLKTTTDYDSMIKNKEITAICISTQSETHFKLAKLAFENNKDVYVEKPITLDVKEAKELVKISKEKNKILMVGHILHYHPYVIKLKEIIKNGEIGKIKNIISNRLNLGIFRKNENVLWSFAVHDISLILNLCGDVSPSKVHCFGNSYITSGVHDITNSILEFEKNDIYVNINVNWLNAYKEAKLTIVGENGMLVFDDTNKEDKLVLYYKYKNNTVANKLDNIRQVIKVNDITSPLVTECKHFIECCETRTTPLTNGEEGVRVLEVLTQLQNKLLNKKEKDYFTHETAIIDKGAKIGLNTKIWHYSHVCKDATIGKNCTIGQNCFIANGAIIGDNCKIQNNVSVYSGVICEDNVFLGPSCVLTNDLNPRCEYSKNGNYINTLIKNGASIGANATIICGNTIGSYSLVGAGSVVTRDIENNKVVAGNPAKEIGTITNEGKITKF
ncbi:MAG: oxidoreductase [Magnetococcales bacterium]|nr:oxidoreductase [Magnetococcales bacterium]|tara:strand:- start:1534 stop:2994 length:1461 start_codon:yes stop_codon:yes gene_type:complete